MTALVTSLAEWFLANPPQSPDVFLMCHSGGKHSDAITSAIYVLLNLFCEDDEPICPVVGVIVPPDGLQEDSLLASCKDIARLDAPDADDLLMEWSLRNRVRFARAATLDSDAIAHAFSTLTESKIVLVANAERYRANQPTGLPSRRTGVVTNTAFGESVATMSREDAAVPALVDVCRLARNLGRQEPSRTLLVLAEIDWPESSELRELLLDSADVAAHMNTGDQPSGLDLRFPSWVERLRAGEDPAVMTEIAGLIDDPANAAFAQAQCLSAAESFLEGYARMKGFVDELLQTTDALTACAASRVCANAGEEEQARRFLERACEIGFTDLDQLRVALQLGIRLEANGVCETIESRLRALYPVSYEHYYARARRQLRRREFRELAEALTKRPDSLSLDPELSFLSLAGRWGEQETDEATEFVAAAHLLGAEFRGRATALSTHAILERAGPHRAIAALRSLPPDEVPDRVVCEVLVDVLERLSGESPEHAPDSSPEDHAEMAARHHRDSLTIGLGLLLSYLSCNPRDNDMRSRVSHLVEPETWGETGYAALLTLSIGTPDIISVQPPQAPESSLPNVTMEDFFAFAEEWIAEQAGGPIVIGRPNILSTSNETRRSMMSMARAVVMDMASVGRVVGSEYDSFMMAVKLAHDLATLGGEEDEAFEVLRLAMGGLALAGAAQDARNLAEHGLVLAGGAASRSILRSAWTGYADVAARQGNRAEALVGWLCACRTAWERVSPLRAFNDCLVGVRVFREVGLFVAADALLQAAGAVAKRWDLGDGTQFILDEQRANLTLFRSRFGDGISEDEIHFALQTYARGIRRALEGNGGQLLPPLGMLGQLIAMAPALGVEPSQEVRELFASGLKAAAPQAGSLAAAMAAPEPAWAELASAVTPALLAINDRDAIRDLRLAHTVARRALLTACGTRDATLAFGAVSLLSDLTIADLSSRASLESDQRVVRTELTRLMDTGAALGPSSVVAEAVQAQRPVARNRLQNDEQAVSEAIRACIGRGLTLHALGALPNGQLMRATISSASSICRSEPKEIFELGALDRWRAAGHPFSYSGDAYPGGWEAHARVVHSMRGLGWSGPENTGTQVVVSDGDLHDIPLNLLLTGPNQRDLLGTSAQVSLVPSLQWLAEVQSQAPTGRHRRNAWVAPVIQDAQPSMSATLDLLRWQLEPVLSELSFNVVESLDAPPEFESSITVVVAHGRVAAEGRYFRVITGEGKGAPVWSLQAMVQRLSRSDIVLFVACSAGRHDRDWNSPRSVGLPIHLLDAGCRAVVASPWPLSFTTAEHFVTSFLRDLVKGATVGEALGSAHGHLSTQGRGPQEALAMHLYGDPLAVLGTVPPPAAL